MMEEKQLIRRQMLQKRAALNEAYQKRESEKGCETAYDFLKDKDYQTLAAYRPIRHELNILPLLQQLRGEGKTILLPRMDVSNRQLTFHEYRHDAELEKGPYDVHQPKADSPHHQPDIILLPLVACDAKGNRLGYGGGYYDRTLAKIEPRPMLIGCGYDFQTLETLPLEPHDQGLDALITPSKNEAFALSNRGDEKTLSA